jgi:phosphoglycerate dehydrogenase-like enzyme
MKQALLLAVTGLFVVGAGARETPVPADPKTAELVRNLGLTEGATALREIKGWKAPRKIVLYPLGDLEALKAAAPGVEFVVVRNEAEMLAQSADADAIFGGDNSVCDPKVLTAAKRVRWLAVYSAGVEACLGQPRLERPDIVVTNMRAVAGPVMAEHTIALAYALARGLHVSMGRQARGEGWSSNFAGSEPQSLTGKTMLIAGLGGIGLEVAERAHGLGMKVIATRGSSREGPKHVSYVGLSDELPTLIAQADVVVAALPLTPATTNLFDSKMFERMKKTAYFINVGRGGSVVTDDLVAALNNGTIAGAGLDVTEPEPLPKEHALWRAKNIIISPHMSARSDLGQSVRAQVLREQVRRFATGDKLLAVVDFKRGY